MKLILGSKNYINSFINILGYQIFTNKYGKPFIKGKNIYFSKSHSKDLSVVLLDEKLCGIDIEKNRKYNELMSKKIFSKAEYEYLKQLKNKDYIFTLLWVLKESYLKCIGVGLSIPMKKISFVKDNTIVYQKKEYAFKVIKYKNHIISICRKDYNDENSSSKK